MLYRLFDLDLESDLPLRRPIPASVPHPDPSRRLEITVRKATDAPPEPGGEIVYESPFSTPDGLPASVLERRDDGTEVLRFPPRLAFHLHPRRLAAVSRPAAAPDLLELRLLGPVLAYVLERRGVPALHASVIEAGGRAVGILAGHGGGKTCLAAALLAAGHALLADDILAVEPRGDDFFALPAYPWQRMAPAAARHFFGRELLDLELVHPQSDKLWAPLTGRGVFEEEPRPLAALFLPERHAGSSGDVEIEVLSPARAIIELVRHSFTPYIVEATGLQPRRLEILARLVRAVPVYRLRFPDGFEHLPRVAGRVLEHG